jgi:hypothetical protein
MLHLLPIKRILSFCFAAGALAVLASLYLGWAPQDDWYESAKSIIRWSGSAALAAPIIFYFLWRFIPQFQAKIFPYLGGRWSGQLHFSGVHGEGERHVTLLVNHTLLSLNLVLMTDESLSRTLVVHAEYDQEVLRKRLYYVYLNERKEGITGGAQSYRGLAIMRVDDDSKLVLHGDYFTDQGQSGTLTLSRTAANPIWTFWK